MAGRFGVGGWESECCNLRGSGHTSSERGSDDAFVGEHLVRPSEHSHGREHGHHRRGSGATRRAIDFGVGKDRHIAQVGAFDRRRAGEDRSVDPLQLRLERMLDLHRLLDRVLDLHPGAAQVREPFRRDGNTYGFTIDDRVERAAERNVHAHLAIADGDRHSGMKNERRHIAKPDAAHSIISTDGCGRMDRTRGRVERQANDCRRARAVRR